MFKIDLSMLTGADRELISKQIQELCFSRGMTWQGGCVVPNHLSAPYLIAGNFGLSYRNFRIDFDDMECKEFNYRDFLSSPRNVISNADHRPLSVREQAYADKQPVSVEPEGLPAFPVRAMP